MQALVKALWEGHTEFDAEHDALRPANRTPPKPLGDHPLRFEPLPLTFTPWLAADRTTTGDAAKAESEDDARGLARRLDVGRMTGRGCADMASFIEQAMLLVKDSSTKSKGSTRR
jgi:hypothetical protein